MGRDRMKYFDAFSGYGGFSLGIKRAYEDVSNFKRKKQKGVDVQTSDTIYQPESVATQQPTACIGFSEIDKYAVQIYKKHFPTHREFGDITKLDTSNLPNFDLLTGGFPCQSFSIAGKRGGFRDTRGTLIFEVFRILKEKQPRLVLLENVKGLLSHDGGRTFKTIITSLAELGYAVEWQVLNAKNFGVPQNRERVFIVGHLGGFGGRQVFPIGGSNDVGNEKGQISNTLTSNYWKGAAASRPIPTDGTRIRRLTPTECERLMGLPDGWTAEGTEGKVSDTQRYKLCGNGVVVNVVEEVIKRLLNQSDIAL